MAEGQLTTGTGATLTLAVADRISIDCRNGAKARVYAGTVPAGASNSRLLAEVTGGRQVVGPYGAGTVTIGAIGGTVDYQTGTETALFAGLTRGLPGVTSLTAAQSASPTAEILADTTATYIGPGPDYIRYRSNSTSLFPTELTINASGLIVLNGSGISVIADQNLLKTAIPFVLVPSGTMADNGAITLGTALRATLPDCYVRLPANAISAGSGAGWYYCVMSSTTVGTVFNNTYTSGIPVIPASPTAFATTGPGAYTQTTGSQITAISITVPGLSMGINGSLNNIWMFTNNSTAGAKVFRVKFASQDILGSSQTTVNTTGGSSRVFNAGKITAQWFTQGNYGDADINASMQTSVQTINTAVDQTLITTLEIAVATDYIMQNRLIVQLQPKN